MKKRIALFSTIIIIVALILLTAPTAKATLIWEPDIGTVKLQADDYYTSVSLGFNFSFYGVTYSSVFINSNGSVTFGYGNSDSMNVSFPVAQDPAWPPSVYSNELTMAAPLWDDLTTNPADTGRSGTGLYTNVIGSAGSREFVATWNDVGHFNLQPSGTYPGDYYGSDTFQIVLFEGSNNIRFSYLDLGGVKSPYHAAPRDVNGITIGVNAGDLSSPSFPNGRATQYLYGFPPFTPSLPEYESLLFTYDPNYHGTGKGGYSVTIETPPPPVPEPSTFALLGIGILAGFLAKKKFLVN